MNTKTLFICFFILLLSCLPTLASWTQDFKSIYTDKGIDEAVLAALKEGVSPEQIIKTALPYKDLENEVLLKALFCALPRPKAIKEAAETNGIKEEKVKEGYLLALSECSRQMEENLNSALNASDEFPGNSSSSIETRNANSASPWSFR